MPDVPTIDEWQQKMAANAANPEPLHPELQEYFIRADPDSELKWDVLKHPLVFGVPYTPQMSFLYNQQFEAKKAALVEYEAEKNWCSYVFIYERPYRFHAFSSISRHLDGPTYWDLLGSVWTDSENLWQVGGRAIRKFFSLHREHRHNFMDEDEKGFLDRLPEQFRVFRGHQHHNQVGFSWTLAYVTATWFGRRYRGDNSARVTEGVVNKSDVVGLLLGRNEMEVVIDPRKVQDIKRLKLVHRPEYMRRLLTELLAQFKLRGRTAHGLDHWNKVDRNAVELCNRISEADLTVARLFAIFHDSCRQDEMGDPKHGHRAAALVTEWYRDGKIEGITEDQFTKLEYACRHHNGGKPVTDPTIGVCFDADRLDLIRVGIIPNPKLLSTKAARDLIGLV